MFKIILPKLNLKIEKWKWNKEYRVYISTLGHIKNEYKQNLPIKISESGYCCVKTHCGYKNVHRLVMLTFKPIPNAEVLTIDHLNHNKRDNSIYNLEWVTKKENLKRAKKDFIFLSQILEQKQPIKSEDKVFKDIDEAVDFIIETIVSGECIPKKENIKNKIIKAISTKKKYCNRRWAVL